MIYKIVSCAKYDGPIREETLQGILIVGHGGCQTCKKLYTETCPYPDKLLTQEQYDTIALGNDTWDMCEIEIPNWIGPKYTKH